MQPLDLLLGLLIAWFGFMGMRAGLLHESATLVGFGLGLLAGGRFYEKLAPALAPWLGSRTLSSLGAFLLILLVTWVIVVFLGIMLRDFMRGIHLGWLDYLGGLVFGLVKGLFLAEILVLVLMAIPTNSLHETVMRSIIGGRLARLGPDIIALVPPVLRYWKPF